MNARARKLVSRRRRLLHKLADLCLITHGSYLERYSTCARKGCSCHQGKKHGPRAYVVVYREGRQHQVYVPQGQVAAIRKGVKQHEQALQVLRQVTDINLKLMREGVLEESLQDEHKGEQP
jgi:hypothetical protein